MKGYLRTCAVFLAAAALGETLIVFREVLFGGLHLQGVHVVFATINFGSTALGFSAAHLILRWKSSASERRWILFPVTAFLLTILVGFPIATALFAPLFARLANPHHFGLVYTYPVLALAGAGGAALIKIVDLIAARP